MDNIKNIVSKVIKDISEKSLNNDQKIETILTQILTKQEKENIELLGFKKEKVYFYVKTPTWQYHFNTRKLTILKKIQEHIPSARDLVFNIGKVL